MKKASLFFYYAGIALIIATALIYIIEFHDSTMAAQNTWIKILSKTQMLAWHAIAIACCFGLSKLLDRD